MAYFQLVHYEILRNVLRLAVARVLTCIWTLLSLLHCLEEVLVSASY